MRLHMPVSLRWGDLDAFNHVNNVSMLKLLEEARVRAFWRPTRPGEDVPATAVLETGLSADTLTLIAHQEAEYLAPIEYRRDPLDIQMWFGKLGGASMLMCYEVWGGANDGTLYARAATSIVMVDSTSMRPRRMSDVEREAWEPYLEAPIEFTRR